MKNIIKYIVIISIIGILFFVVFFRGYLNVITTSYNPSERELNSNIVDIDKTNSIVVNFMKGQTIDTSKVREIIPSIITNLQQTKDKTSKINITDKYKSIQLSLLQGLSANINLYKQLLNILNNPNAHDIGASRDNLKKFKEDCISSYSQASKYRVKVGLQQNVVQFVDSSIYYVEELVKLQKNQTIINSQNTDFITGVDSVLKNFQELKTDYKDSIQAVRKGTSNYDEVINLISKNKTDLSNLEIDFAKISIPPKNQTSNPVDIFNFFKSTLDDYSSYLDSFTYAVANEKAQASTNSIDTSLLNKLYSDANLKMSDVTTNYNNFIQSYNSFKDLK
jgi:hypothetical protein